MDEGKRERRFLEAVRLSGLVPELELDRAVAFQKFAHARGKPLPLDRILLKFGLLDRGQIDALYQALRYFLWRKEDKLYAKVAVNNQLLTERDAKRCLKEQKRAFKEQKRLRRLNDIAFEKGLISPRDDRALVARLKEAKPKLTLAPLNVNGSRGPAKKGEEEQWRREVRARELEELQHASGAREPSSHTERFDEPEIPAPGEESSNTTKFSDDELAPLAASPEEMEPVHLSTENDDDDLGDPLSSAAAAARPGTDDDLDPLWAEADLDDVELDSEQREAAKGSSASAEDDTDLF